MRRRNGLRPILLAITGVLVTAAAGWYGRPEHVLGAIALLLLVYLMVEAARVETTVSRILRAQDEEPRGIRTTLAWAGITGGAGPAIRTFADPYPCVIVVRGWFGKGTIFLSQGLMAVLREQELREILALAARETRSGGLTRRSTFAVVAHRILSRIPERWHRSLFRGEALPGARGSWESAAELMMTLAAYPLVLWLVRRTAGRSPALRTGEGSKALEHLERLHRFWEKKPFPAFRNLWLGSPGDRGPMIAL